MSVVRSSSLALSLLIGCSLVGCGGAVAGQDNGDGGHGVDSGAGQPDAGRPPPEDASAHRPDGALADAPSSADTGTTTLDAADAAPPPPVPLAPGKDLILWGVTSDRYAIYSTATAASPTLYAVSLSGGGAPIPIGSISAYAAALVRGSVVVVLNEVGSSGTATLQTWTSKGGVHTVTSSGYGDGAFGVSSDGQWIAYFANYVAASQTADAYVAKIDAAGATLLQKGVAGVGYPTSCYPELAFVGASAVLSYCPTPSTMSGSIFSFSQPTWKEVTLIASAYPYYTADPTGKNLLINTSSGLEVVPVSGGTATTIDATGQSAAFTSDGKNVVYVSYSGALLRSPVASPSPTTLVASGLLGILGLSPDDGTALLYEHYDSSTYLTDLYTASATTAGSVTTLSSAQTVAVGGRSGIASGSPFTGNSSSVLYFTGVSTSSYPYLGTLEASPTGASSAIKLAQATNTVFASGKTKAVFEDNYTQLAGSSLATVDIETVDTSSGAAPKLLVASVNASGYGSFFLSPDGSQVVYAQNATTKTPAGVFSVAVP